MRRIIKDLLYVEIAKNNDIIIVTADLGYKMWDSIKRDFPKNFINVGAAEQLMIGTSIGLALSGKIPIAYSISPFLIYRPFELLRTYVDHENIPIKLLGAGRTDDYKHDGISHYEDHTYYTFKNIISLYPNSIHELINVFHDFIYNNLPTYLNLKR